MDSPLDDFPSESSSSAPRRQAMVPPRPEALGTPRGFTFANLSRSTPTRMRKRLVAANLRVRLLHAVSWMRKKLAATGLWMAASGVRLAALSRTVGLRTSVWRQRLIASTPSLHHERLSVIATAAFTSAGVSLLTMWLWSPGLPPGSGAAVAESRELAAAPVGHVSPVPQETHVRQETPVPQEAPVQQETPVPRDAPVLRETPVPQEAPVPRETPPPAARVQKAPVRVKTPMRVAAPTAAPRPLARDASLASSASAATSKPDGGNDAVRAAGVSGPSSLVVVTEPPDARVTINGVGWGTTPLTIRHLPPGAKRIRVTKAGYRSEERVIGVDTARTLRIVLRPEPEAGAAR